jgi:uncharacterized DUF497 family protein
MIVVWDEIKRRANVARRGMDFADLDEAFFDRATIAPSVEGRLVAVGEFKGATIVAVAFRPLGSEAFSGDFDASRQQQGKEAT